MDDRQLRDRIDRAKAKLSPYEYDPIRIAYAHGADGRLHLINLNEIGDCPKDFREKGERLSEFDRMIEFLDMAYRKKDMIVPCLVGPVGIGKTAAVNQHAKNVGAGKVVTIIASQILPSEVSGITMPVAETKSMEIFDHYRLSSLEDGDILFFDELLEADQCVLSACLTLIESRMMMSGKLLPDIQIIAACNPTVNPTNIRENIRQRFMFMQFDIDRDGVADYIERTVGFRPSVGILKKICATDDEFNILSPRTLTKMCSWIASSKNRAEAIRIGHIIDRMFNFKLGSDLVRDWEDVHFSKEKRAKRAMKEALKNNVDKGMDILVAKYDYDDDEETCSQMIDRVFSESSMDELLDTLKSLPEWDKIAEYLSDIKIYDDQSDDVEF